MACKVSVLMAVYNGEKFLVSSVNSILNQTFKDFEFIIVNDGSIDGSGKILSEFARSDSRIKIINNPTNIGLTRSLNIGLGKCFGEYIARVDADDTIFPDRLSMQLNFLEMHPEVCLCGSQGFYLDEVGNKIGEKKLPLDYGDIKNKLIFNNQLIHSAWMIRARVLEEVGFYDESFRKSQDYELLLRIAANHEIVNLSQILVGWRLNKESLSWIDKRQEWDAIRARWRGITRYGYPKLTGFLVICVRIIWILIPQKIKLNRKLIVQH